MSRFCNACGKDIPEGSGKRIYESNKPGFIGGYEQSKNYPINSRKSYETPKNKTKDYKGIWNLYCDSCLKKKRRIRYVVLLFISGFVIYLYVFGYKNNDNGKNIDQISDVQATSNNSDAINPNNYNTSANENINNTFLPNYLGNKFETNNLSVKVYRNGDSIDQAQTDSDWDKANNSKTGAWCYYENNPDNGVLYNKYAVNDSRGLAPKGYHIPSEEEWKELIESKNTSAFTNIVGGFRKNNCNFSKINKLAYFWIAERESNNNNIAYDIQDHSFTHEGDHNNNLGEGYSVKCIKD